MPKFARLTALLAGVAIINLVGVPRTNSIDCEAWVKPVDVKASDFVPGVPVIFNPANLTTPLDAETGVVPARVAPVAATATDAVEVVTRFPPESLTSTTG